MELHIYLKEEFDKKHFIDGVYACIRRGYDLDKSEIKTWKLVSFTNRDGKDEAGLKHSGTQYEYNGWVTLRVGAFSVVGEMRRSKNNPPEPEDEAIILFRFASMIKRHFNKYVRTISLTGL